MKRLLIGLLALSALAACNKPPVVNYGSPTPIFNFKGTIGNDTLTLEAGVNHIYMYTNYFKDSQNLWTLEGTFANDSCSLCEPNLTFQVKDVETSTGSTLSGDFQELFGNTVLTSYSIDSVMTQTPVETFNFMVDQGNPSGTTYFWSFGDGTSSSLASPSHIFPLLGTRNVRLISTYNGFTDTLTNLIDASYNSSCRVQFNYYASSPDSVMMTAPLGFNSYLWDDGNGGFYSSPTIIVNYGSAANIFTATLTAAATGCSSNIAFSKKIAVNKTPGTYCLSNYSYTTSLTTQLAFQPRINKNAFIITYKKDGKTYNSWKPIKGLNQSTEPVFTLNSFNLYIPNEYNQSTIRVNGSVDTYLYNKDNANDSIKIKSNELNFAVAFPR